MVEADRQISLEREFQSSCATEASDDGGTKSRAFKDDQSSGVGSYGSRM